MVPDVYAYNAKVERVIDGDSIDLSVDLGFHMTFFLRVRILGIDTPETRTRDLEEKKAGLAAKAYVQELLTGTVRIRTVKTDSFGRWLAHLWYEADDGWHSLSAELIKTGHAVPYTK